MALAICEALPASPPRGSNCCLAAYPQTQWSWLEAERRNHISRRLAVRIRRVLAPLLAHSLYGGARRGERASKAAHECCLARGTEFGPWKRGSSGEAEKGL